MPDRSESLLKASGPGVILYLALPVAVAAFAFWANRRPDRGRLLTFTLVAMAGLVLFLGGYFFAHSSRPGGGQLPDPQGRHARASPSGGRPGAANGAIDADSEEVTDEPVGDAGRSSRTDAGTGDQPGDESPEGPTHWPSWRPRWRPRAVRPGAGIAAGPSPRSERSGLGSRAVVRVRAVVLGEVQGEWFPRLSAEAERLGVTRLGAQPAGQQRRDRGPGAAGRPSGALVAWATRVPGWPVVPVRHRGDVAGRGAELGGHAAVAVPLTVAGGTGPGRRRSPLVQPTPALVADSSLIGRLPSLSMPPAGPLGRARA